MPWKHIKIRRRNSIMTITMQRPEVLNALNRDMLKEIDAALAVVTALRNIRAVVITGAEEKAFSVGADINNLASMSPEDFEDWLVFNQEFFDKLEEMRVPVIAALNGYTLGGGLELALACDIRLAKEGAQLGFPESQLGLIPGTGGTQRLTRLAGPGVAKELILSGRTIDADEALRLGLVSHVLPAENWEDKVEAYATAFVKRAPLALEAAKSCINAATEKSLEEGLGLEREKNVACFQSNDFQEGLAAFQEKRDPSFRGN
jgi:enoyl-CoA hydratase